MKLFKVLGISVCLFFGLSIQLSAQSISVKEATADLIRETGATVSYNKTAEAAGFIRFPNSNRLELSGSSLKEKVISFLDLYGDVLGIVEPSEELEFQKSETDDIGFTHLFYDQKYLGVPVFGGDLRFHFDDQNRLAAINGVFIPKLKVAVIPNLGHTDAADLAIDAVDIQETNSSGIPLEALETNMYVFKKGLVQGIVGTEHLVFEVLVGNQVDVMEYVYIDAHNGETVEQFTGTHSVLHRKLYEDNTGNLIWEEGDAFPGSLDQWQRNEVATTGHSYYFFFNAFGRDSYDDAGAQMRTINNNPSISCPNANWNGSTTNYCTGTAADDVVGHEWGHAYTQHTSGLIYAWQSGALNESFSDIWGETIDLINGYEDAGENLSLRTSCNSSSRWMVGEDAPALGGPIRDMWDPTCKNDPGKVTDGQYRCGEGDSGGVHTNSGVNNHAYALLVDGGSYNGQNISSLGLTKTAHIFWRAQRFYLTNTSDFAVQADALEASCSDLIGINLEGLTTSETPAGPSGQIITTADSLEVAQTVIAVEFRLDPPCGFLPMLAENAPDLCQPGKFQHNYLYEGFENGIGGWTVSQVPNNPSTWFPHDWEIIDDLPENRPGSGMFGADLVIGNCSSDLENGIIRLRSPWVTIPVTATPPILLAFDHYASMELNWDGGNIKYKINSDAWALVPSSAFVFNPYNGAINGGSNDNPMAGQEAFTGADQGSVAGSWGQSQIDVTQLGAGPGDNIRFRFELGTDGCNGWDGWYIDDVYICSCELTAPLPVGLKQLAARPLENSVLLTWETATELNNLGFEIERRSSNTEQFEKIGWMEGTGNSQSTIDYEFKDITVEKGVVYYYRLKQLDFNGEWAYSNIVSAEMGSSAVIDIQMHPNPANNFVEIRLDEHLNDGFEVELFNVQGEVIFQSNNIQENIFIFEVNALVPGLYFVNVKNGKGSVVKKLIVE